MNEQSSSLSEEVNKLDSAASSVKGRLDVLKSCVQKLDRDERRLDAAAEQCLKLSSSTTEMVSRLRLGSSHRILRSTLLSVRSTTKKNQLRKIKEQLAALRHELQTELLINIW